MAIEREASVIQTISDIVVRNIAYMGGDWMVIAAARVSADPEAALAWAEDPGNAEEKRGLIRALMKGGHGTPFEHGAMIFFAHAPLFVFYEWHRHRVGFSYNEESGRYKKLLPVFWVPRRDRPMTRVPNYRAMRPQFQELSDDSTYEIMLARQRRLLEDAWFAYEWELENGVAHEVARRHLPVSIYKSMWVTCNPRSMMKFLELRTHEPDALFVSYPQLEIEEAARSMETFFATHWPVTYELFNEFGRHAP